VGLIGFPAGWSGCSRFYVPLERSAAAALLDGPVPDLLQALTEESEQADAVRKESPFSILLSEAERRRVFEATRAALATMRRGQLQHVILEIGRSFDLTDFHVIGSAAILAELSDPPEGALRASRRAPQPMRRLARKAKAVPVRVEQYTGWCMDAHDLVISKLGACWRIATRRCEVAGVAPQVKSCHAHSFSKIVDITITYMNLSIRGSAT